MVIQAYYGTRRGGSGVRTIHSAAEAEKILKGGYGATTVRLEDSETGALVVQRWRNEGDYDTKAKWLWFYDQDQQKYWMKCFTWNGKWAPRV